ncbi:hypothetical protein [Streptomyces sp. NPDC093261]|uniref:hypothetical protein n=1 Tax=Streptomyces sp. NPDC093261 TaxID=3366037 RepID=UPI003811631D
MSLADRLNALEPGPRRPVCSIRTAGEAMSKADRQALTDFLADRRYSGRQISDALRAEGFAVSAITVNRHRRGECSCGAR